MTSGARESTGPAVASWSHLRKVIRLEDGSEKTILDLPALTIPRGRLTCILGPSGCGKTTLLAILGLVDVEYEGDLMVHLDGEDHRLGEFPERRRQRYAHELRRHIGYIFQEVRLRDSATALDNVTDPLMYLGRGTPSSRQAHARECLSSFGIEGPDQTRRVAAFSGGMQQRTGLARALSVRPDLICADEPTAHVDAELADTIYQDLKHRAAQDHISVVVVTHDEERARRYGDHIIRIQQPTEASGAHNQPSPDSPAPWPFEVEVETETTGLTEPRKPVSVISDSPMLGRVTSMLGESFKEFLPLLKWCRNLPLQPFVMLEASVRRRPSRLTTIPSHLYSALAVSILTFAAHPAMGVFFHGVRTSVLTYQQEKLNELEIVRRIVIKGGADALGNSAKLDTEKLGAHLATRGYGDLTVEPQFELLPTALTPEDAAFLRKRGRYSPAVEKVLRGVSERRGDDRRFGMKIAEAEPGDPLYVDLGLPEDPSAFGDGSDGEGPKVFIRPGNQWSKYGTFSGPPRIGDQLSLLLRAEAPLTPGEHGLQAALCVTFEVAGDIVFEHEEPTLAAVMADSYHFDGVIRQETMARLLSWAADPLNEDKASRIPPSWRCARAPDLAQGRQYQETGAGPANRDPKPLEYWIFARSPMDVEALQGEMQTYLNDEGIRYAGLTSKTAFITPIVRLMRLAELLGKILQTVPLLVATIVLWLVIHSVLQRRRKELLLCLVMGAPVWQIQLQSWFIGIMIALPGLMIGYGVATFAPELVLRLLGDGALVDVPEVQRHIAASRVGLAGLGQMILLTLGFCTLASVLVTRTITHTNPAGAFRGME